MLEYTLPVNAFRPIAQPYKGLFPAARHYALDGCLCFNPEELDIHHPPSPPHTVERLRLAEGPP